ncbi:MAG: tRNA dihydrouridine synthase DusB [Anaeroplasma sp.]|nr:tRNA dihydrouridine synthase DusB [Anaeroplasma sp.]
MSFKIREIEIKNKLVLAPMAGVTNEAFRIICKEMNAGLVMAEMVSDKAIGFKNAKTLKMTRVNPIEHPISMQIFGADKESLVSAAKFIDEYSDADIIDINMGCPVNKVAKKSGAGASLLQEPEKVYEIVKAVVEAVKKPVTVKIRIGWDFDHINCVENAKLIEKAGASAICVHGRTRSQFYSGNADLKYIKMVKEAVSIPVIGNGDITDIKSAQKMFDETGCDAIAIARGALGNPFIFRELNAYFENNIILPHADNQEIFDTIVHHYNLLLELKGEHLAMLEMRSHVSWYIKGRPSSAKIKDFCNKQTDFNIVIETLRKYLLEGIGL